MAEVTGTATQEDVFQIRADVTAVQRSLQQTQAQVDALNAQVSGRQRQQTSERDRQTTELGTRLDSLTATVHRLSSRLDDLSARVEALNRQTRVSPGSSATPTPVPTPRPSPSPPTATPAQPAPSGATAGPATAGPRTAARESASPSPGSRSSPGAGTPGPGTAGPAAPATASAPAGARPATGPARPQDLYQAAYIDFSKGSYTLAVSAFREFLRRFPEHELAGNAQYWIGESYFSLARGYANSGQGDQTTQALQQAVLEFRKVIANYPRSDTAPTALYKEALALIELKQPALAQQRLQYLVDTFPQSAEVPLARERLAALKDH